MKGKAKSRMFRDRKVVTGLELPGDMKFAWCRTSCSRGLQNYTGESSRCVVAERMN